MGRTPYLRWLEKEGALAQQAPVMLLSNGGVRAPGKPEQVLTPDGLAEVYGMHIHVMPHPVFGTPLVLSGE